MKALDAACEEVDKAAPATPVTPLTTRHAEREAFHSATRGHFARREASQRVPEHERAAFHEAQRGHFARREADKATPVTPLTTRHAEYARYAEAAAQHPRPVAPVPGKPHRSGGTVTPMTTRHAESAAYTREHAQHPAPGKALDAEEEVPEDADKAVPVTPMAPHGPEHAAYAHAYAQAKQRRASAAVIPPHEHEAYAREYAKYHPPPPVKKSRVCVVVAKAYVRSHTRTLPGGRTVTIPAYFTKRTAKGDEPTGTKRAVKQAPSSAVHTGLTPEQLAHRLVRHVQEGTLTHEEAEANIAHMERRAHRGHGLEHGHGPAWHSGQVHEFVGHARTKLRTHQTEQARPRRRSRPGRCLATDLSRSRPATQEQAQGTPPGITYQQRQQAWDEQMRQRQQAYAQEQAQAEREKQAQAEQEKPAEEKQAQERHVAPEPTTAELQASYKKKTNVEFAQKVTHAFSSRLCV